MFASRGGVPQSSYTICDPDERKALWETLQDLLQQGVIAEAPIDAEHVHSIMSLAKPDGSKRYVVAPISTTPRTS